MISARIFCETAKGDAASFLARYSADRDLIVRALLAGEDRRGRWHFGIDPISIFRAVLSIPVMGRLRGVSTIELQYVRTVFRRRGNIVLCKLLELFCIISLGRRISKEEIWLGYLWRAYYGHGMNDYPSVRARFVSARRQLDERAAAQIVACLKYPRPKVGGSIWRKRHERRTKYILARFGVRQDVCVDLPVPLNLLKDPK